MNTRAHAREIFEFLTYTVPFIMVLGGILLMVIGYLFNHADTIKASGVSIVIGGGIYTLKFLAFLVRHYSSDDNASPSIPYDKHPVDVNSPPSFKTQKTDKINATHGHFEIPESPRLRGKKAIENLHTFRYELEKQRGKEFADKPTDALIRATRELALTIGERIQEVDEHRVRMCKEFRSMCDYVELMRERARERTYSLRSRFA